MHKNKIKDMTGWVFLVKAASLNGVRAHGTCTMVLQCLHILYVDIKVYRYIPCSGTWDVDFFVNVKKPIEHLEI